MEKMAMQQKVLRTEVAGPGAEQLRQFWQRLQAAQTQQYRPKTTDVLEDALTGRRVKVAPGRQQRHVETDKPTHLTHKASR